MIFQRSSRELSLPPPMHNESCLPLLTFEFRTVSLLTQSSRRIGVSSHNIRCGAECKYTHRVNALLVGAQSYDPLTMADSAPPRGQSLGESLLSSDIRVTHRCRDYSYRNQTTGIIIICPQCQPSARFAPPTICSPGYRCSGPSDPRTHPCSSRPY